MNSKHLSFSTSLPLSLSLPLYVSHSSSLSKTCLVYDIICLLIPPLSCCLNYYHYSKTASKPCCRQESRRAHIACRAAPVNSISAEVGINIFRPIQMIQRWGRLLLQITPCPINTYKDGDNMKVHTKNGCEYNDIESSNGCESVNTCVWPRWLATKKPIFKNEVSVELGSEALLHRSGVFHSCCISSQRSTLTSDK